MSVREFVSVSVYLTGAPIVQRVELLAGSNPYTLNFKTMYR